MTASPDPKPGIEIASPPASLRALRDPCRRLFVRGRLPSEDRPWVAIVGTRAPSPSGEALARTLARDLARSGVVIVSGLARGIDVAAHRGALDAGGATVAVLAGGVDEVTPRSSRDVGERIPGAGALVSEYPLGTPPAPYRFVERNRIVAGLSRGVVVVEGGSRSGALITAGMALELGRDVWAVPGDPRRSSCRGSNRLLRDGAGVVLEAADVLCALDLGEGMSRPRAAGIPAGLGDDEDAVWRVLAGEGPGSLEVLGRRTRLPTARLLAALSHLEVRGTVRREAGGFSLETD